MEIEKYIVQLLFEEDCIIVPGFGGFITQYTASEIHPVTHRFIPPRKKIAFNENLAEEQSNLALWISEETAISLENVERSIAEFVNDLKAILGRTGFVEIKEVGRFFYNPEKNLEFEPLLKNNYLEESFGLPEFVFKPIDRNNMKSRPAAKKPARSISQDPDSEKKKKRNLTPLIAILPLVVLLGAGAFVFVNKDNEAMKAKFPFSVLFSQKAEPVASLDSAAIEEEILLQDSLEVESVALEEGGVDNAITNTSAETSSEIVANPEDYEIAVSGNRGNYSVIIGSFGEKKNAEKLKQKLEQEGQPALIIQPAEGSNYYRVSVAEFNKKEAAMQGLETFRQKYGQEAWVMGN